MAALLPPVLPPRVADQRRPHHGTHPCHGGSPLQLWQSVQQAQVQAEGWEDGSQSDATNIALSLHWTLLLPLAKVPFSSHMSLQNIWVFQKLPHNLVEITSLAG